MRNNQFVILCVDDDPDILDTLKLVLEGNHYVFVGAANAAEGLDAYKKNKPDFVLVDMMMESVEAGIGLAKDILALGDKVPVFMLSSIGDQLTQHIDTTELGLTGVFQKPVEPKELIDTLKQRLG
jgi:two-component system chemotaxis response regulator CheY